MIREEDIFEIGRIVRVHGLKGEVEMAFTDDIFDRGDSDYLILNINGIKVPFFWEEYRFKNNDTVLLKFEDVDSEADARPLVGCEVFYPTSLQGDDAELTSWTSFTGYAVYDADNNELGVVERVDEVSTNVLLTVRRPNVGANPLLIPLHPDLIVSYDIKQRTLTLEIPEGLLSLND